MPLETKAWKIEDEPRLVTFEPLASEAKLQHLLEKDLSIVSPNFFLVGPQITTAFGNFIDLLAVDDEGNIVVIELKKDKTPRTVVAQLLDYASWAHKLGYAEIVKLYADKHAGSDFAKAYSEAMGMDAPEELSGDIRLLIVASVLDPESERIVSYLSRSYGVPINAVFFRYFQDGASEFLTGSWLIDPSDLEVNLAKTNSVRHRSLGTEMTSMWHLEKTTSAAGLMPSSGILFQPVVDNGTAAPFSTCMKELASLPIYPAKAM